MPGDLHARVQMKTRPVRCLLEKYLKSFVSLQDIDELKAMPWDVVVLDERSASKSFAQKMYPVLQDLAPRQRLSMRDTTGDNTPEQLLAWAAFLKPNAMKARTATCLPVASHCLSNSSSATCCHCSMRLRDFSVQNFTSRVHLRSQKSCQQHCFSNVRRSAVDVSVVDAMCRTCRQALPAPTPTIAPRR